MTVQNAQTFRTKVDNDPALQQAIRGFVLEDGSIDREALIRLAQQHQVDFSVADMESLYASDDELSDFEMDLVSAGIAVNCNSQANGNV